MRLSENKVESRDSKDTDMSSTRVKDRLYSRTTRILVVLDFTIYILDFFFTQPQMIFKDELKSGILTPYNSQWASGIQSSIACATLILVMGIVIGRFPLCNGVMVMITIK